MAATKLSSGLCRDLLFPTPIFIERDAILYLHPGIVFQLAVKDRPSVHPQKHLFQQDFDCEFIGQ